MNIHSSSFKLAAVLLSAVFCWSSCGTDVENLYSSEKAFMRYDRVQTTAPLLTALNNPGMYCTISVRSGQYHFVGNGGTSADVPLTEQDKRFGFMCMAGFIVGTPDVPDLAGDAIVAYDLACPHCYRENSLTRALVFSDYSKLRCGRCGNVYDLQSDAPYRLFRYHATYSPAGNGLLLIQN